MKKSLTLAGLVFIFSGALVAAQQTDRGRVGSPMSLLARSDDKDQKPGNAKSQKNQEEKPKYSKEQILKVQKALKRFDYYDGPLDGKLNEDLRLAIRDFQDDENLPKTGELDEETFKRILLLLEEESGEEPLSEEEPPVRRSIRLD